MLIMNTAGVCVGDERIYGIEKESNKKDKDMIE
jgi:hypothetical protein